MALSPINPGGGIDQNQHLNHEHPMMKVQMKNDGTHFYCDGCGDPVLGPSYYTDPSYYTCNICYEQSINGFDLHESCAELTGEIHHPIHRKHPLTLDTSDRKKSCSACHQDCFSRFSYSCFQCEFNIDFQCASNWHKILDVHDHKFTLHRKPAQLPCEACGKESFSGTGVYKTSVSTISTYTKYGTAMYLCSICQLLVHGRCSKFPTHIKTAEHQHRLKLTWWFEDTFPKIQNFCDLCYESMDKSRAVYYCEHECCSFVAHNYCATRRYEAVDSAADDDDRIIYNQIQLQIDHFSHPHVLALINSDHQDNGDDDDRIITCNGCIRPITKVDAFYSCTKQESSCPFFLHTACAQLPKQIHVPFLFPDLELHPRAHSIGGVFKCLTCDTFGQGFVYLYRIYSTFGIDLQCAILRKQKSLKHEAHVHTLHFNKDDESTYKCRGCGTSKIFYWFSCRRCDFHLCFSCVKLPPTARHRYDNHPLKLTYDSVKNELDEYYCEICEGKRDPKLWFYSCSDCDFDCHPHCILGRYLQVKLGDSYKHWDHPHPVTLVEKRRSEIPFDKRERILPCEKCGTPCEGLVFECSECDINVHVNCPRRLSY